MITGAQIRAARKLLGWPRDRLCPRAGLSVTILRKIRGRTSHADKRTASWNSRRTRSRRRRVHEWRRARGEAEGDEDELMRLVARALVQSLRRTDYDEERHGETKGR